jgi:hypothetical protein
MWDLKEQDRKHTELLVHLWRDANFRREFDRDPLAAIRAAGLQLPEGTREVKVVEDSPDRKYFVVPVKPPPGVEPLPVHDSMICCC